MQVIVGEWNQAVVYTDAVEAGAASQILQLCNQPFVRDSKIRIMPDVHAGVGCTIGTTMTIADTVVPNLVGVDIGCGMEVVRVQNKHIELPKLDTIIKEKIPSGFRVRDKEHRFSDDIDLDALYCKNGMNLVRARLSIGTLGGGNHFIEANRDEENQLYIVVHSGSRHLGVEVAEYYQKEAYGRLNQNSKKDLDKLIKELKATGQEKEIRKTIKERKKDVITKIPKMLAYAEGELFTEYVHDMKIVQYFAELNRKAMVAEIVKAMKLDVVEQFTTIHNYIDLDTMILRKGAVSAQNGEKLLIPMNMRDGSLVCIGKGNPDWNFSAPHGAGRLMSRTEAKNSFTVSEYKKTMNGIYSTTVNKETLDEAPMAYKPMEEIIRQISDTVDIIARIKPIYNFKAAE